MDTGDRLAAYLSGDLDPDERSALEAELAGDADLRARLGRVRAADQALAGLDEVELPEGFEDRLAARLRPELDAVLGDELAVRRARRAAPRWLPAIGAAAVLAVVVAGGLSISGGLGGGDDMAADTAEEADEGRILLDSDGDAATGMAESGLVPQSGPFVVDRNRSFDRDDLGQLTRDPDVRTALSADRLLEAPAEAALPYARALGLPSDDATTEDTAGGGETATAAETEADGESVPASGPAPVVSDRGAVSDDDRAAVAACLPVLFEDAAAPVVPVYVELGTDADGAEVIVYVALAPDADGEYQRLEIWMVDRDGCTPRLFLQDQAQPVDRNAP